MSSMTQEEINVDLFDEVKRLKAENRKIKEELKLVLEPKSCEGCIFYTSPSCPIEELSITSAELEKHPFYCNRYEQKDNA